MLLILVTTSKDYTVKEWSSRTWLGLEFGIYFFIYKVNFKSMTFITMITLVFKLRH